MTTNLQLYHKILDRLCQWLPEERITRNRTMALLILGLYLSRAVHLALAVRKWPSQSKERSLINRLRRFLDNSGVAVRSWYEPIAADVLAACAGQRILLVIDTTKVGFNYRLMTIGTAYKGRTLPLVWSVHRGGKGHTSVVQQVDLFRAIQHLVPDQSGVDRSNNCCG